MPLTLDNPDVINGTVTNEYVTGIVMDYEEKIAHIIYDRRDVDNNVIIKGATHTVIGVEFDAMIARASIIAGADIYAAFAQAQYEYLPGNGTIS